MKSTSAAGDREPTAQGEKPGELRYFVEIFTVCGLAIGQPLLSAFGTAPEHLVFLGVTTREIIIFSLAVVVVPALAAWGVSFLAGRFLPERRRAVQAVVLAAIFVFALIQLGWRAISLSGFGLLAPALIGGIGFGVLYARFAGLRLWTAYAAVIPVAGVASFLFTSPASDIIFTPAVDGAVASIDDAPPIVMLLFDELPTSTLLAADGTIDEALFPSFAALADDASWYRNNSSASNYTTWAVPALLSGKVPRDDAQAVLADHPENLFSLLGEVYDIRADEAPTRLCPDDFCEAVENNGGGFRQLVRDASTLWRSQVSIGDPGSGTFELVEGATTYGTPTDAEIFAAGVIEFQRLVTTSPLRFSDFLGAIEPSSTPSLHYLHIQVPHAPWRFYPSGVEYELFDSENEGLVDGAWIDEAPAAVARQRHLLQAQYADRLLAVLVDHLESQGLYEETMVIVASDHGISFEPGRAMRGDVGEEFPAEIVGDVYWAPLFIKEPNQSQGVTSDLPTETIDLLPTVVDLLGIDSGWTLDGTSISDLGESEQRRLCRRVRLSAESFETGAQCADIDGSGARSTLAERGAGAFLGPAASDDDPWRVYRAGPHPELVGLDLADLVVEVGDATASVRGLDAFADVALESNTIPGLVSAQLPDGESGAIIALSLNGTIAGVTETFDLPGQSAVITAILPEFLFRDGSNELAMYEVGAVAGEVQLVEIGLQNR